ALEDYENQTIDLAQGRVAYVNEADKHGSQSQVSKQAGAQRNRNQAQAYHAAQRTGSASNSVSVSTGAFDPHVEKSQNVRATLRCRLVEVGTGNTLGSVSCSFATNRAYVAAANGNNMMDTGELVHAVAGMLAQTTGLQLTDIVYPIRILEKANQEVTIGRGSAARLQIGQVYEAFMGGKDIKGPATGAILAQEELKVGKFSTGCRY